jgi:hypothetical protein
LSDTPASDLRAVINDPATVRRRCHAVAAAVERGQSPHFRLDRSALPAIAQRIAALTRRRFPDLQIPYHSRWRHFEAGGVDRQEAIDAQVRPLGSAGLARARIDLALISVLLDAGAGPDWHYDEAETGQRLARSEGLAVATLRAFAAGAFSSVPDEPCRVDAQALLAIDAARLAPMFQVGPANPLVGLEGRAALLRRLGEVMLAQPERFGPEGRPGRLFDRLAGRALMRSAGPPALQATELLAELLASLAPIWPSGQHIDGLPVGDVWPHPAASAPDEVAAGQVPFHKLSQWLTYSLLEPFEWAGIAIQGLDALTGLPEYRNGGLLIDGGALVPRAADFAALPKTVDDPWVIEWRALTVALLDDLAPLVRAELGVEARQLPLACMLEGGSWAAGREIAAERRPGGTPPLRIDSDGTVF